MTLCLNPSTGVVALSYQGAALIKAVSWVLYNQLGRAVQTSAASPKQPVGATMQLDFSSQPKGLYFLHLTVDDTTTCQPLRIQPRQ